MFDIRICFGYVCVILLTVLDAGAQEKPAFQYSSEASPQFYMLKFDVDFGAKQYDRSYVYRLKYDIKDADSGEIAIASLQSQSTKRTGSYSGHPVFPLLSDGPSSGTRRNMATISRSGELIRTQFPAWLGGLPFDLNRLPFPQIPDGPSLTETRSIARFSLGRNRFRLFPVSSKIQDPGSRRYGEKHPGENAVAAVEKSVVTLNKQSDDSLEFLESREYDGSRLSPAIAYTSKGGFTVSKKSHRLTSLKRTVKVLTDEPGQRLTATFTIELTELNEEGRLAFLAQDKARAAQLQEFKDKQAALASRVPAMDDVDGIANALASDDKELFKATVRKLNIEKELAKNTEWAEAILQQSFNQGAVDYTAKKVAGRLDPQMTKTISVLEKCLRSYGFDIALTGELLKDGEALKKGCLLCYPEDEELEDLDKWMLGRFVGEVDGVLVIAPTVKKIPYVAIPRDLCRHPDSSLERSPLNGSAEK